ncbi:MAG: SLC13 family permease, partial [Deltaproteobacteria bacterium]|nr:SLC13 family permease [Deltaproteobacteria bacterium]
SFMAILGGTVTLIGTSTNLVVAGMARNRGIEHLDMFTFSVLGVAYMGVGAVYMFTVGRWLLPARDHARDLSDRYGARDFDIELSVGPDTAAIGETAKTLGWDETFGASVMSIARPDGTHRRVYANRTRLAQGDRLVVRGEPEKVLALARDHGLRTLAEDPRLVLDADDDRVAELLVVPGSPLVGRTLRGLRFQDEHEVVVLGIKHHDRSVPPRLAELRLAVGDLLLVHGPAKALDALADQPGLVPLRERAQPASRPRAWVAVSILVAVVAAAATGAVSILVAAMSGAVLMIFVGCVRLEEVYRELDWRVVALLAGLLPLGLALDDTGGAKLVAGALVDLLEGASPAVAVLGFYLVASVLTEVMSNAAAAVVLTPVALEAAHGLHLNPLAMVAALMFGCSASFMTPTGYQTNTMIYGPGGYRFADFLRVGVPLNLLMAVVATLLIPVLWPS